MNTQTSLTVLGRNTSSNVQKVMWLMAELGHPCRRVDMGGLFGGNKEPDYLAKNPNGVVPTLIDGDTVVWESNTILRYLANRFGATSVYPVDHVQRAWVERWMDWQLSTLGPANTLLFQAIVRTPAEQRKAELINDYRNRNAALFAVLNAALGEVKYLGGDALTLADIALGPLTYRWFELPVERQPYENLQRWYDLLRQRPAFQEHIVDIGLS